MIMRFITDYVSNEGRKVIKNVLLSFLVMCKLLLEAFTYIIIICAQKLTLFGSDGKVIFCR